jgi:hypothetical protein
VFENVIAVAIGVATISDALLANEKRAVIRKALTRKRLNGQNPRLSTRTTPCGPASELPRDEDRTVIPAIGEIVLHCTRRLERITVGLFITLMQD